MSAKLQSPITVIFDEAPSIAFLITETEIAALREALSRAANVTVSAALVLDRPARPGGAGDLFGVGETRVFEGVQDFVSGCDADLLVISDRIDLLRREVAFAVVELALKGAVVCTLSQFLARPNLRRDGISPPEVVQHLLRALIAAEPDGRVKRAVEAVAGGVCLLFALPLLALIALAIKLDSPGPVLFVQERLGRLRAPFPCFKFRTMHQDAERATGPVWASKDDPRITRVGRLLRRSRLDELPQLINVLRGEMSLVGARPIRQHFADQLAAQVPFYDIRFAAKPGITGLAQVKYNYASTYTEQIEKFYHDCKYLQHHSLRLDLYILLITVWVVARMKGT